MKAFIIIMVYIVISLPALIYLIVNDVKTKKANKAALDEIRGKIGSLVRAMNAHGYEQAKAI